MNRSASVACGVLIAGAMWSAAAAASQYDVSYVWASNLENVRTYKQQVAQVLGPEVARKLKVVRRPELYGVIYYRQGDSRGAARVARVHSRLLKARGLEAAAPIQSHDWNFVPPNASAQQIAKTATAQPAVSVPQTAPESAPETRPESTPETALESAPQAEPESAPQTAPAETQRPKTAELNAAVERYVNSLRRQGLVEPDERTAWSVYDFTTGEKLVDINEDVQFQAASLIKPFVALAFMHKVEQGDLIYGPKSRQHMQRMIHYSNNRSTNWVMRQLGGPQGVQAVLNRHYSSIFQETSIVEYIPANGRTYRNKASAHDYSRFLYALWNESVPGAREIKRLMAMPGPDRIFTGASAIPAGTLVYNKTGSTARLCGDMGILVVKGADGRRYPYTLIGIIQKDVRASNYGSWINSRGDVIRGVSSLVYTELSQQRARQTL